MLLKSVPSSASLVKLCTSSSVCTASVRNFFIHAPHLYPRKARWTVNQSPNDASALSSGALDQNEHVKEEPRDNSVLLKCRELLLSVPDESLDIQNSDVSYYAKFGLVRLDSDNKHHLRDNESDLDKLNVVDKQYFGESQISGKYEDVTDIHAEDLTGKEPEPGEFIDRHYFGTLLDQDLQNQAKVTNISVPNSKQDLNKEKLNYVDELYFKDEILEKAATDKRPPLNTDHDERFIGDFEKSLIDDDNTEDTHSTPSLSPYAKKLQTDLLLKYKSKMQSTSTEDHSKKSSNVSASKNANPSKKAGVPVLDESTFDQDAASTIHAETKYFRETAADEPTPNTAYDYAVKLRKQKKEEALQETSENGSLFVPRYKRIINSVLDLRQLSKYELRKKLEDWIIYDDHDIVGFYKPYGLRAQGGGVRQWDDPLTLADLLPELCQILAADHLHHIHRLDANTTGVLLFARTEAVAQKLHRMFKEHALIKTYLAIVKNVPRLAHGLIDVPLKEGAVEGKTRMVPQPEVEGSFQRGKKTFKAVTKFKVVSKHNSAALLSLQPVTGVKHQIRSHLGLVLNCPILADHKYSSSSRMVPQKLPSDMLLPLQIKQSRVRDLPTMLHASSIFLPQFVDGKNLKISCPPPPHFTIALKALKLSSQLNATKQKSFDYVDVADPKL